MKIIISLLFIITINIGVMAQSKKDSLFMADGKMLVQEIRMMWNYDQGVRKYLEYQTFNKHLIDSIESLPVTQKERMLDSLKMRGTNADKAWSNYITPADHLHARRMIEIIKKYGFPSNERIRQLLGQRIEFNTYIILVHSPKEYAIELKALVKAEHENGNFPNKCLYGHLLWHLNGRNDMKYFLENGYVWEKQPDGSQSLVPKNCG